MSEHIPARVIGDEEPMIMIAVTLRDCFAGQALQGMLAAAQDPAREDGEDWQFAYARLSYGFADAMLAERDKALSHVSKGEPT